MKGGRESVFECVKDLLMQVCVCVCVCMRACVWSTSSPLTNVVVQVMVLMGWIIKDECTQVLHVVLLHTQQTAPLK